MSDDKQKKKRLSKFSFEHDGAAVALVGDFQGGPANGVTTLITKSTDDITDSELEKALDDGPEKNSQSSAEGQDEDVEKRKHDYSDNKAEDEETKSKKRKEENSMTKENDVQKSELEVELQKAKEQLAQLEKAQEEAEQVKQEKADLEKSLGEVNKTVEVLKAAEEKRKNAEYLEKAQQHSLVVTEENPATELAKSLRIAEDTEGCESLVKAFEAYREMFEKEGALEEIGKSKTDDQPTGSKLDVAIEKAKKEHSVDYMKALEIVQNEHPELFAEEYSA